MERLSTRRDRLRAATVKEITETARRLLSEQGPGAVTLRAIAREMGMTAPALYRYFSSHEELIRHVVGDVFNSLTDAIHNELQRDHDCELAQKFVIACDEFRRWSMANKREYSLIFQVPLPGLATAETDTTFDVADECSRRFARTFLELFLKLWDENPFPILADNEIDPVLYDQLCLYRRQLEAEHLPIGVMVIFLDCWFRLQGFVSQEVFGHMEFALPHTAKPMFDYMINDLGHRLGLTLP